MFNFKDKEIIEDAEKQYKELLKNSGYSDKKKKGFVLGEKKDIYDKELSLEDIINQSL